MPEAGWYDDPEDAAQLRYWDGSAWTAQRRPRDLPPPPPPLTPPAVPNVPLGTAASIAAAGVAGAGPAGWPAPSRTFPEAVQVSLSKYVDFTGRAARSEYWYFFLFTVLVGAVASALSVQLENAVSLALFLPTIAAGSRRLHDIGRSGWNQLWWLLPFIGWIIIIVRLTRAGDPGPNAYG